MQLLKVTDIYKLDLMVLFYNMINNNFLSEIEFKKYSNSYKLININDYRAPFPRTNALKMQLDYRMPLIWNDIPPEIRQKVSKIALRLLTNVMFLGLIYEILIIMWLNLL